MSELSIHELEAQHGEVLPEREALSVGFAFGSFNHRTTVTNHHTHVSASNSSTSGVSNSFLSSSRSEANQYVSVNG